MHGGGQIWPPLIFRPQIAKFHKFSCKAIPWTHTFHLRPSKVISDRIQGHSRCPKMIDRFSLKCPHGRNYGPIALKFEMYTQNTLLFDICYVFWKIAKNGDFRFWGSVLTNPQNDPHDPPIIFFSIFLCCHARIWKNIKSQWIWALSALRAENCAHFLGGVVRSDPPPYSKGLKRLYNFIFYHSQF